jgi:16S rRNA processing protein RimM
VHNDSVVVVFSEIADRDAAHALKGATLSVEREALRPPGNDEFYWIDLVGCQVTTVCGETLGSVSALLSTGAHDVLSIDSAPPEAPRTRLVPFVSAYVKSVSITDKTIVVEWDPMWD